MRIHGVLLYHDSRDYKDLKETVSNQRNLIFFTSRGHMWKKISLQFMLTLFLMPGALNHSHFTDEKK